MDIKTIIERLRERHNIVALNEMQQLMAGTSARKIILLSPTGSGKTFLAQTLAKIINVS